MINTRMRSMSGNNSNNNNTNTVKDDDGVIHTGGHRSGDLLDAAQPVPVQCFIQRRSRRRKDKANGKGSSREPLSPLSFKSNLLQSSPVLTVSPRSPERKANCASGGKRPRRLIKSTSSACDTPPRPARSRTKKRMSQFFKFRSPKRDDTLSTDSSRSSYTTPCIHMDSKLRGLNKENSELSNRKRMNLVSFFPPVMITSGRLCRSQYHAFWLLIFGSTGTDGYFCRYLGWQLLQLY